MMDDADFLVNDILHGTAADPLESAVIPSSRAIRLEPRHRFARVAQRQSLRQAIGTLPRPVNRVHCTTGRKVELFTSIPEIVAWLGSVDSLLWLDVDRRRANAAELFHACRRRQDRPDSFCHRAILQES